METDWDAVRSRTLRVRSALTDRSGSRLLPGHRPPAPLTDRELTDAEQQFGVTLPDGYREFLLHVDSGGIGPVNLRRLSRSSGCWAWEDDQETDHGALTTPFPDQDSYEGQWDELEAMKPQLSDEAGWAAWNRRSNDLERAQTTGVVYLSDNGCGFYTLLVVSGTERGNIWFDRRATSDVIVPLRHQDGRHVTFTDFYLDWLSAADQTLAARGEPLRSYDIAAPIWEGRFDD
ncbi:SMI1/KNR4 family protein [Micromonospora sp. MED01]|uniref:SMI1/KNR4 family protein n=1 Tax=Micromonospora alfalfae TaxID=2911212 RepID=UPI001EE86EB2|nr:SMI1/KNR4 family protein [Micromonospora alfalfae]MCG5460614.1 SMI1/KNR4 family protein [Micromonospora alfalfae]